MSAREPGVMSTNCRPTERLAAIICEKHSQNLTMAVLVANPCGHQQLTNMSMDNFRFIESMYTSLEPSCQLLSPIIGNKTKTYNSSKHRTGEPIASHNANNRQICENDFSPPESVLAPRPALSFVISGSTCVSLVCHCCQLLKIDGSLA